MTYTQSTKKPVVLIILDGWGMSESEKGNAIKLAKTPYYDALVSTYPNIPLSASGLDVGLPLGEDGNTETGHLNIGAGRVVFQDLPRINNSIADGSFFNNPTFLRAIDHTKQHQSTLHLLGLIGSGGVHSSMAHLEALIEMCHRSQVDKLALHLITDGRDSPPTSAINFVNHIQSVLNKNQIGFIASLVGRYYAMDRDYRWERTKVAYEALTKGVGDKAVDLMTAIQNSYQQNVTDEFLKPIIAVNETGLPKANIQPNDAVIFFNFRIDRPRQLTKAFVFPNFQYVSIKKSGFDPYAIKYYRSHLVTSQDHTQTPFDRGPLIQNLHFVTMTEYETGLPVQVAFPPEMIDMPIGKVIADMGLRQLRMAETEKERFVTFYFNGQRDDPFPGEDRIIIPSPPVSTYDQVPAMSSKELTETLIERLKTNLYDFICINFANPDMIGHTGNLEAGIKSCGITDENLKKIIDFVLAVDGCVIITGDHGNVEEMVDLSTGGIDTEHSTNPVPFILISKSYQHIKLIKQEGRLADIAPTILNIMNLPIPTSMNGESLVGKLL